MNFARSTESTQISLLGEFDRVEHRPNTVAATSAQRWTTRDQVAQLLARDEIRALWPTGNYVAADPCAGIGQLMRHVDDLAPIHDLVAPNHWVATELDAKLVRSRTRYRGVRKYGGLRGKGYSVSWEQADSACLEQQLGVQLIITNLPWFRVFARLVGHWRSVAFPNALVIALCDEQERTRSCARAWLASGNWPTYIAPLPGRQSFDGADDGAYPFACSWYIWRPGEQRHTSTVLPLEEIAT